MKKSNKLSLLLVPLLVVLSLYISGYITQFIRNYNEWKLEYGLASGVSPKLPSGDFMTCVKATFSSDGLNGIMIIGIIIGLIIFYIVRYLVQKGRFHLHRRLQWRRNYLLLNGELLLRQDLHTQ